MRYAIMGARGQLGQDLFRRLHGEVIACNRPEVDLTQPVALKQALVNIAPDCVINCAAYNLVDRAEEDSVAAFAVNAIGVSELARICRELDCVLVHFSTDYVFGWNALSSAPKRELQQPYAETDAPAPVNTYGISKLAGECAVRLLPRHFVIRTCGLYGHGEGGKGGNFVKTMLRLADQGNPIRVVNDQVCTPTSAADLSEAVCRLLPTQRYGLYHLTNSGACTWHEFAQAVFACSGKQVEVQPISTEEFAAKAQRPRYSVLANQAWAELGLTPLQPWQDALRDYIV